MIDKYEALTLGTYMRVNAVLESDAEDLDKQVEIIAILGGMAVDEVLLLPLSDYSRMAAQSAFLRKPCPPTQIAEDYRFGDLAPVLDFTKINTAQYVDFQTFSKGFPQSLPQLLSVFMVPEGKAYNEGYDVQKVQEQVKQMPFPDAIGLAAFFFGRFLKLTMASLTSWASEMRESKDPLEIARMGEKILEVRMLLESAGVGLQM